MNRPYPALVALLLFSIIVSHPTHAQESTSNSAPVAPSGQVAQTPSQASPLVSTSPATKRIWTNDDVSDVRAGTGTSNHPASLAKSSAAAAKPSVASKGKDAKWYHDQIAKLQAQLPPLQVQISSYQAALAGKPIDETRLYGGVKIADWPVQLAKLQQKRDDIVGKIAAREDQARHNNIPASSLP